jgi:hypothetical protein
MLAPLWSLQRGPIEQTQTITEHQIDDVSCGRQKFTGVNLFVRFPDFEKAPTFFAAIWAASWAMALPGVCEDLASLLGETNRGLLSKAGWFFHLIICFNG